MQRMTLSKNSIVENSVHRSSSISSSDVSENILVLCEKLNLNFEHWQNCYVTLTKNLFKENGMKKCF